MRLFVEVGFQSVRLFRRQETGLGLRMPELQASRSGEQVLDRKAPFTGKSFDPLSRHPIYTIRPLSFYPVGVLLPPLFGAARDVLFYAGAREIPSSSDRRTARRIQPSDANNLRGPRAAPRNPLRPVRPRPRFVPSTPSRRVSCIRCRSARAWLRFFSRIFGSRGRRGFLRDRFARRLRAFSFRRR